MEQWTAPGANPKDCEPERQHTRYVRMVAARCVQIRTGGAFAKQLLPAHTSLNTN